MSAMVKTIVQINTICNSGSTGHIMNMLQQAATKSGYQSIAAYGRGMPSSAGESIRIGNYFDILLHVALTRALDRHGYGSKNGTREFIHYLEKLQPDVIHLHNIHGYYLNMKVLFDFLKTSGIHMIWTLHDCWAFTGHCAYFDYEGCTKWTHGCMQCRQLQSYPRSIISDHASKSYIDKKQFFTRLSHVCIVTPSRWLADHVKQSFLNGFCIEVIPNGIDLEVFRPVDRALTRKKLGLSANQFMLLGVAVFKDPRKGLDDFIELANRLQNKGTIVLVGLEKCQLSGLPENIIGLRHTDNMQELAALYSTADVFVNPTLQDNYPTVIMESLACGTPVVAYETGGIPEQIINETGFLVPKGDINRLYEAVLKSRDSPREVWRMTCREFAEKLFGQEQCINRYMELYKQLLSERSIEVNIK